ncbi:MAG: Asd/ArgC dimerization domain-containing protein [Myxococcota bacterium]
MADAGLRIGVIGATGAVGSEVLAVLAGSSLRVDEIFAAATDRSVGQDVEFRGEAYPVRSAPLVFRGLDLLFLCAPPAVSLDCAREALRARVPSIDLSGALALQEDVPLRLAGEPAAEDPGQAPLVASPTGAALAWALVLRPLDRAAGLRRVVGTALDAASVGGRSGIESLFSESLAIFNQHEAPEPGAFSRPVAFDCLPSIGPIGTDGRSAREAELTGSLARLLGPRVQLAASVVQVPAFVGHGSALAVETERPLDPKGAEVAFAAAERVELWEGDEPGPTTRAAAGREAVLVGRVRRDPSLTNGLLLWLVADPLRLAASCAVALAEARLR